MAVHAGVLVAPARRVPVVWHVPGDGGVTACCGVDMTDPGECWTEGEPRDGEPVCGGGWGQEGLF